MKVNLEERHGQLIPVSAEIENDKEVEFLLDQLRPEGHWIRFKEFENGYLHIKCSNCGQYWSVADHGKIFKFCFNCGAAMKGGAE